MRAKENERKERENDKRRAQEIALEREKLERNVALEREKLAYEERQNDKQEERNIALERERLAHEKEEN